MKKDSSQPVNALSRLKRLQAVFAEKKSLLIVMQDFPDPDAIASAAALREIALRSGIQSSLASGGIVSRAENRALVRYLDLNIINLNKLDLARYDLIAMVDTQPATGNNSLAAGYLPHIVIDHHPIHRATRRAQFHDIRRRYGATSTMLFEYMKAAGIKPSTPLATALTYGIRSDTSDLGRETTAADISAFFELYVMANKRKLSRIEVERLPRPYFSLLARGLANARLFGHCVITDLGEIDNPDMIGEVADLLLRNEESDWALCFGIFETRMLLSIRTSDLQQDAGKVIARIVGRRGSGGGHNTMAGGQISVDGENAAAVNALKRDVIKRYLKILKQDGSSEEKLVKGEK